MKSGLTNECIIMNLLRRMTQTHFFSNEKKLQMKAATGEAPACGQVPGRRGSCETVGELGKVREGLLF